MILVRRVFRTNIMRNNFGEKEIKRLRKKYLTDYRGENPRLVITERKKIIKDFEDWITGVKQCTLRVNDKLIMTKEQYDALPDNW